MRGGCDQMGFDVKAVAMLGLRKELVLRSTAMHNHARAAVRDPLALALCSPQVPTQRAPFSFFARISNSMIKYVNNRTRLHYTLSFRFGCIREPCLILQWAQ
jgi:hypothetical protein